MRILLMLLKRFLFLGLLLLCISSGYAQKKAVFKDGIHQGVVKVKFTPNMTTSLANMQIKTNNNQLQTGVTAFDNVVRKYNASGMERVFTETKQNSAKLRKHGLHLWYVVEISEEVDPRQVVKELSALGEVSVAECDYEKVIAPYTVKEYKPSVSPYSSSLPFNDPLLKDQWHYKNSGQLDGIVQSLGRADINLFDAWRKTAGRSDIIVSVHDEGVDVSHEDLKKNLWFNTKEIPGNGIDDDGNGYVDDINGFNFISGIGAILAQPHGTHVAGTIAAVNNNGIGVSGVAGGTGNNDGVKIMSLQMAGVGGTAAVTANSFIYAADNGSVIASNSWGYRGGYFEQVVHDAIDYFVKEAGDYPGSPMKGGIVIFASGNFYNETTHIYPAAYPSCISVGAIDSEWKLTEYTDNGNWLSICAPGGNSKDAKTSEKTDILSTLPDNKYGYTHGTSQAAPHVSGIVALIVANSKNQLTAKVVKDILLSSGRNIDKYNLENEKGRLGTGAIDAQLALKNDEQLPPNTIADFAITGTTQESVSLQWTVPKDPDDGVPEQYYLYYSTDTILTNGTDKLTPIIIKNDSRNEGVLIPYEIADLYGKTKYYFAITAADRWNNMSRMSNVLSTITNNGPKFEVKTDKDDNGNNNIVVSTNVGTSLSTTSPIEILNNGEGLLKWNYDIRNVGHTISSQQSRTQAVVATQSNREPQIVSKSVENYPIVTAEKALPTTYAAYSKKDMTNSTWANLFIGENDIRLTMSSATKFVVSDKDGFNLTNVEAAIIYVPKNGAWTIEIYKNTLGKSNLLHSQKYDKTYYHQARVDIPLNEHFNFAKGDEFYVVVKAAPGSELPLGIGIAKDVNLEYASYCYYSDNGGDSWMPLKKALYYYSTTPQIFTWDVSAVSKFASIDKHITLTPESGNVQPMSSSAVTLTADGSKLVNGVYKTMLLVNSNDGDKKEEKVPVSFTVSGHKPVIAHPYVVDFGGVFDGTESIINIELNNTGLGRVNALRATFAGNPGFTVTGWSAYNVEALGKTLVGVRFKPTSVGSFNTKLTLSNGTDKYEISLYGVGKGVQKIAVTPPSTVINNVTIGDSNIDVDITVKNEGTYPLTYFVPNFDKNGLSNNWPSKYHKYGYMVRSNRDDVGQNNLTYQFDDISTTGVDITSQLIIDRRAIAPIGFDFPFYETTQDTAYITRGGFLVFDSKKYSYGYPTLGTVVGPEGYICPLGIPSINFNKGEKMYYKNEENRFIIQYQNVEYGSNWGGLGRFTVQIVLYLNGDIRFIYEDISDTTPDREPNLAELPLRWASTVLIEDVDKKDGIILKKGIRSAQDSIISSGTIIGFDHPGAQIISDIENGSGVLSPGESAVVKVKVDSDLLKEGVIRRNINFVSDDPKTTQVSSQIELNVVSGGKLGYQLMANAVDFGNIYKGHPYTKRIVVKNIGTKNLDVALSYNTAKYTIVSRSAFPGFYVEIDIVPNTTNAAILDDELTITYHDGKTDKVSLKAAVLSAPVIKVDTVTVSDVLELNGATSHPLVIENTGQSNLEISTIAGQWFDFEAANSAIKARNYTVAKYNNGEAVYNFIELDTAKGATMKEYYVETIGEKDKFWTKVELPFAFDFYGTKYDSIFVGDQGVLALGGDPAAKATPPRMPFVDGSAYIAAAMAHGGYDIWDVPGSGTYYQGFNDKFIVTWECLITLVGGSNAPLTAQAILHKDGTIKFQYILRKDGDAVSSLVQVGIQKPNSTEKELIRLANGSGVRLDHGLGLAYLFTPVDTRIIAPGEKVEGSINVLASKLYGGNFTDSLVIVSNDPASPKLAKKMNLTVNAEADIFYRNPANFGTKEIKKDPSNGSPFTYTVNEYTITNTGNASLVISEIKRTKGNYDFEMQLLAKNKWTGDIVWTNTDAIQWNDSWDGTPGVNYTIAPGRSLNAHLVFAPTVFGDLEEVFEITTNIGVKTLTLKGSAEYPPMMAEDKAHIDVKLSKSNMTDNQTITISNIATEVGAKKLKYGMWVDYRRAADLPELAEDIVVASNANVVIGDMPKLSVMPLTSPKTTAFTKSEVKKIDYNEDADMMGGIGFGVESLIFEVGVAYVAGPTGINISNVGTWFIGHDATKAEVKFEIRAGGSSINDAKPISYGTLVYENNTGISDIVGKEYNIKLDNEASVYPNEKFYLVIRYPSHISAPLGMTTGNHVEQVANRYLYRIYGEWKDAQHPYWGFTDFTQGAYLTYVEEHNAKDNSWLKIMSPSTGIDSIVAGESKAVELTFIGSVAELGTHDAALVIQSNDYMKPLVQIPIRLHMNEAPFFTENPIKYSVTENVAIEDVLTAMDTENDEITITAVETSSFVTHTIDGSKVMLTLAPKTGNAGLHSISFKLTDAHGENATYSAYIDVKRANTAPVFIGKSELVISMQQVEALKYEATDLYRDEEGDVLTCTVNVFNTNIAGAVASGSSFMLTPVAIGQTTMEIVANDGHGGETKNLIKLIVEGCTSPNGIIMQKWNKLLGVNNSKGEYLSTGYQWYKDGKVIAGATKQNYVVPGDDLLDPTAEYQVRVRKIDGNDIFTCAYIPSVTGNSTTKVYPNPIKQGSSLNVETKSQSTVQVINLFGAIVKTAVVSEELSTLEMNLSPGYYIIRITDQEGEEKTFKVLVK